MKSMPFKIYFGTPEMDAFFKRLKKKKRGKTLSKTEEKLLKKLVKTTNLISNNPRHSGLCSHEISDLSDKAGFKVFESYVENNTPSTGRIFWTYGPGKGDITILGYEPHPEDGKRGAYKRIKLSNLPEIN